MTVFTNTSIRIFSLSISINGIQDVFSARKKLWLELKCESFWEIIDSFLTELTKFRGSTTLPRRL